MTDEKWYTYGDILSALTKFEGNGLMGRRGRGMRNVAFFWVKISNNIVTNTIPQQKMCWNIQFPNSGYAYLGVVIA